MTNILRKISIVVITLFFAVPAQSATSWTVDGDINNSGLIDYVFGTFDFDLGTYSNVDIEVVVGGGSTSFTDADISSSSGDFLLELIQPQGGDLTGSALLVIQFDDPLEDFDSHWIGNGSAGSFFGTCDNAACTSAGVLGDVTEGEVYSSVIPVPAAVWLFGTGLIGLIGVARRKSH